MSEIITTAGASGTDGAAVAPAAQPPAEDRIARAAAAMFGKPDAPAPAQDPAPAPAAAPAPKAGEPSLAEVIRANREARQAAQAAEQRRSSTEAELKAARDELARLKAARDEFEADPVGYAKARKWTHEQQLMYGQSLLYDLAPEKADPDFRIKMFEERQEREKREREKAEAEAAAQAEQAAIQAQVETFYNDTAAAVRTFEAGSYPESSAWFGDDFGAYMQSLMATARNVSQRAQAEGKVADLRPESLAAILEAATAQRLAARDARKQARAPQAKADAVRPADGMQTVDTLSMRNMTGAGSPRPPATDEKERIRRAAEAAFRSK